MDTRLRRPIAAWALAALAVAASGVLAHAPRAVVPLLLFGPVIAFALAARRPGLARDTYERLPIAVAIGFHVLRAPIGAVFLVACARGDLPSSFAVPAGVGDVLAGLGAVVALVALAREWPRARTVVTAWNLFAFADIVMVVANAQRLIVFGDDAAVRPFLAFPFPLLPLFVVPVVFITHGIVHFRYTRRRDA